MLHADKPRPYPYPVAFRRRFHSTDRRGRPFWCYRSWIVFVVFYERVKQITKLELSEGVLLRILDARSRMNLATAAL